jgi:hypothetical protein
MVKSLVKYRRRRYQELSLRLSTPQLRLYGLPPLILGTGNLKPGLPLTRLGASGACPAEAAGLTRTRPGLGLGVGLPRAACGTSLGSRRGAAGPRAGRGHDVALAACGAGNTHSGWH